MATEKCVEGGEGQAEGPGGRRALDSREERGEGGRVWGQGGCTEKCVEGGGWGDRRSGGGML